MIFKCVNGKLGTMRKEVEWVLCPQDEGTLEQVIIQSDARIAKVDLPSGKAILSDGKGGHPGFHKLSPLAGAKQVEVPAEMLAKLRELCSMNKMGQGIGPMKVVG